jgi:hypothetical protein
MKIFLALHPGQRGSGVEVRVLSKSRLVHLPLNRWWNRRGAISSTTFLPVMIPTGLAFSLTTASTLSFLEKDQRARFFKVITASDRQAFTAHDFWNLLNADKLTLVEERRDPLLLPSLIASGTIESSQLFHKIVEG